MPKPISTAVLSYGMSGRVFHCPLISANKNFSIDSIVRRNGELVSSCPDAIIYKSVDGAIADPKIELVIVNLPNQFHFNVAANALKAGKHVVVEKPFTVTTREAQSLISLAKKHKKLLTVFQSRRWDGDFLTIKKIVDKKWLGRVVEFVAHYDRYRNFIQTGSPKEEPGLGSGILYNLGSHMIDQALCLFGLPQYVDARVGTQRSGGKIDDWYDIRMQYKNHLVILKSSYLVREQGPRYVLHGEKGSFIKFGTDPQEQDLIKGKLPDGKRWGAEPKKYWGKLNTEFKGKHFNGKYETMFGNYPAFYNNVYDCIRKGKSPDVKASEAMAVIKIIEACIESNRKKKAIRIKK